MFSKTTATRLIWSLALALLLGAPALAQESAWEQHIRRNPEAVDDDSFDPLVRRVLHALRPEQADALFEGTDPSQIVLDSGQTLAGFLADSVGGGPGLVYVPVDQCRLFATAAQTAPVTGQMAADEIREYVARGAGVAHTDQGGMVDCGIPTEAVAIALHLRVKSQTTANARGYLKAWASDAPEPSTHIVDYEPEVEFIGVDRFRDNNLAILELCSLTSPLRGPACATGEFKIKTALLGGHVRGDVSGYFRPVEVADVPGAGDADTLDGFDSLDFAFVSHTHDGGDITSGTVGEPYIDPLIARDDEVVDIVKAGDGAGSGIDADLLDGLDSLDLMLQVDNCLTVSASCPAVPADALAARCWQTVSDALAQVGTGLPAASATNRYVIKVGPGIYAESFTMKPFVDIEGSGQKVTTISNGSDGSAVVGGADNAELRSLTVDATGGGAGPSIAMGVFGTAPMLKHVTLKASGGGTSNIAMLSDFSGAAMLTHATLMAADETAIDQALNTNTTSNTVIRDSVLQGDNQSAGAGNGSTLSIVNSQLIGAVVDGPGTNTITCLGAYDNTFTELGTDCQP